MGFEAVEAEAVVGDAFVRVDGVVDCFGAGEFGDLGEGEGVVLGERERGVLGGGEGLEQAVVIVGAAWSSSVMPCPVSC
ncbi:MAG: hypothetical protein JJU45_13485 [Acidimicrobiia bacterium]|nr:hypothetical protein [Acidimicrobiia bacterium]